MNSSMMETCFTNRGPKCAIPKSLPSQDAIAGPATLIPFCIITCFCFLGTLYSVFRRFFRTKTKSVKDFIEYGTVVSSIVFSLNTTQMSTSIAFSLAALVVDDISAYHYNVVCYLVIAALFTFVASILAPISHLQKSFSVLTRLVLFLMLLILSGLLMNPRWIHFKVFPGRTPLPDNNNRTALVLRASCLTDLPDECNFSTDRRPLPVVSDVLVLIPLLITLLVAGSVVTTWGDVQSGSIAYMDRWPRRLLLTEILVILVSGSWAAVALWQCFDIRNWMNASGLLADRKEMSLSSFGAFVPFFTMLGTALLLTSAALDELRERREKIKLKQTKAEIELANAPSSVRNGSAVNA